MALVVISGYPASGKSTRAEQMKTDYERRIRENDGVVDGIREVVINDIDYDGRKPYDSESVVSLFTDLPDVSLTLSTQLRFPHRETRSSTCIYAGHSYALSIAAGHPGRAQLYQRVPISALVCGKGGEGAAGYVLCGCA
jgi:hypothetical protein